MANLKEIVGQKIKDQAGEVKAMLKEHGGKVISEVTLAQAMAKFMNSNCFHIDVSCAIICPAP